MKPLTAALGNMIEGTTHVIGASESPAFVQASSLQLSSTSCLNF